MLNKKATIAISTGNGRGKTTSALGTALRAVGWGQKVLFAQFVKSPEFETGEAKAIKKYLKSEVDFVSLGLGFVGILGDKKTKEEHKKQAQKAVKEIKKLAEDHDYDLIVLDEVLGTVSSSLLSEADAVELVQFLSNLPHHPNIILTGRKAPKSLLEIADLVSEVKKIKHPFDKGVLAEKGFDF